MSEFHVVLILGKSELLTAWYERRQLKKIYSPLMEALLALYLGFEWVQVSSWLTAFSCRFHRPIYLDFLMLRSTSCA